MSNLQKEGIWKERHRAARLSGHKGVSAAAKLAEKPEGELSDSTEGILSHLVSPYCTDPGSLREGASLPDVYFNLNVVFSVFNQTFFLVIK